MKSRITLRLATLGVALALTACKNPSYRPPPNGVIPEVGHRIKILPTSDAQRQRNLQIRQEVIRQAEKLGQPVRANRVKNWPERVSWTNVDIEKRDESNHWFAEQDPSPRTYARTETVKAFVSGSTKTSWSRDFGMQVTYLASDGRSYLWFPGNNTVLQGQWEVQPENGTILLQHQGEEVITKIDSARLCFRYGVNTRNAVTGSPGGRWECQSWGYFKNTGREYCKGDTFGLAARNGAVPFLLSREEDTIAGLQRKLKSSAN